MAEFKYEPQVERKGTLSLTEKEVKVLEKLLGNLSYDVAEKKLELTEEEYVVSCDIYNVIED